MDCIKKTQVTHRREHCLTFDIRMIRETEYDLLKHFLYEAIYVPEGVQPPPETIIESPELQVYISDFGKKTDICCVAEINGKVVGAAWSRIMDDYGHIEDGVPSVAISVDKEYRGNGIGTELMKELLHQITVKKNKKVSLSVQKENYAVELYEKLGFVIIGENDEEYYMVYIT